MNKRPTALMEQYCDGDTAAFHELYELTSPRLLAYLKYLVRDQACAEELLQQTFIKLHQARHAYVRGADPIPWMYTIAHRTGLDELRRGRRSRVHIARGADAVPELRATIDGGAEGSQSHREERLILAVLQSLDRLPESQRLAVVLTKMHGKSMAEAASILGTTPGAVKLRAHRGYVALRKILHRITEES